MNFFLKVVFFCFISLPVVGQKNITIIGQLVENETETVVEEATVRLLALPDSSLVTGVTSGKDGKFTLKNIAKGNYVVLFSYIGYQNLYKNVQLTGKTTNENLGKINFYTDDIMLAEAVVVAKANEMIVKKDTIEYNAASFKTEENAVVEDLLKKLPGVEVDSEGKITVGGKEIKKILVDGKEFFSDDPKVASKNLPVNMIEKLQVLDQKSDMALLTGFDDGEEQAVINLTVKPGMKKESTFGNAMAGLGHDTDTDGDLRYEIGGTVNHMNNSDRYTFLFSSNNTNNMGASDLGRTRFGGMRGMNRGGGSGINTSEMFAINMNKEFSEQLKLNGDISYNNSDRDAWRKTNRTTDYIDRKDSTMQSLTELTESQINDKSDNIDARFRLEWKPDDNNTLIFRPNFSYNRSKSEEDQKFESYNGLTQDSIANGISRSYSEGSGHAFGGTLEYAHQFSKVGRVFSVSLEGNYSKDESQETYNWLRHFYEGAGKDSTLYQQSESNNESKNLRVSTSYVEPLGNNYFLQLAYRISRSNSEGLSSTYDLLYDPFDQSMHVDTASLNTTQSRSTIREATQQRFGLNLKSMRESYNFTIGLNIDPNNSLTKSHYFKKGTDITQELPIGFDGHLPNLLGDSIVETKQNVVNLSPTVNFRYNFGERTNLRVDYRGSTSQPSTNQLNGNPSNPQNLIIGNPNLKPGYQNTLTARFDKFIPTQQVFYNFGLNGGFSVNDISPVVTLFPETSSRETTYKNVNGNWNASARATFNMPLKNKKFSINSFVSSSFDNKRSYTNNWLNTMQTFNIRNRSGINYRSDLFDIGTNVSFSYANSNNDVNPQRNERTYNYGISGNNTWYLPYNFSITTDISWSARSGYSNGFNKKETIWNASITKQLFNKKAGVGSVRLKIFDILQDRKNISRSVGDNYIQDSETNNLQSFFMGSFIYRFNIFPAGSSENKNDVEPEREYRRRSMDGGGGRGQRPQRGF